MAQQNVLSKQGVKGFNSYKRTFGHQVKKPFNSRGGFGGEVMNVRDLNSLDSAKMCKAIPVALI